MIFVLNVDILIYKISSFILRTYQNGFNQGIIIRFRYRLWRYYLLDNFSQMQVIIQLCHNTDLFDQNVL